MKPMCHWSYQMQKKKRNLKAKRINHKYPSTDTDKGESTPGVPLHGATCLIMSVSTGKAGMTEAAGDSPGPCSDTIGSIDIHVITIHTCTIMPAGVVLSNRNQHAWRRCHIQTGRQSGGCRRKQSHANVTFPLRLGSNNPHRDSYRAVKRNAVSAPKQDAGDRFKVNAALPGAGVLKKTVRSATAARLNININMLARAVALTDLIKVAAVFKR